MIAIELPGLRLFGLNKILRMGRQKFHAYNKKVRQRMEMEALVAGLSHVTPATARQKVVITIRHKQRFDRDGLYAAAKPILDAIVARPAVAKVGKTKISVRDRAGQPILRWGLVLDDSDKYIDLEVRQEVAPTCSVRVEVSPTKEVL